MAKIEIDIALDGALADSGDGDNDMLGMVDEGSFGSSGDDKSHITPPTYLESKFEDDGSYNYNDSCQKLAINAVTYRLVEVGSDDVDNSQPTATSVQPFRSSGSSTDEKPNVQTGPTIVANSINGQLYVISNPNDMYMSPGAKILPRETNTKSSNVVVKKRDDRRRATHNEVERRRRDKINNWIVRLSKIIPASHDEKSNNECQSKGGILAKACEYIIELKNGQTRLNHMVKDSDLMAVEIIKLNQKISDLQRENTSLRNQLSENGIIPENSSSEVS